MSELMPMLDFTYWIDDGEGDPIDPAPFAGTSDELCREELVIDGLTYICNRDVHPTERSRCMSLAPEGSPPFVLAAWPGDHAPTEEDL